MQCSEEIIKILIIIIKEMGQSILSTAEDQGCMTGQSTLFTSYKQAYTTGLRDVFYLPSVQCSEGEAEVTAPVGKQVEQAVSQFP